MVFTYADRTLVQAGDSEMAFFTQLILEPVKQIGIMKNLSTSLKSCFGNNYFGVDDHKAGYTNFSQLISQTEEDNIDYYLVFSPSNVRSANANSSAVSLLFSFRVIRNDQAGCIEIYDVCKTNNPGAKSIRASEILNTIVNGYFTLGYPKAWLGVLFGNPNYLSAITSYLRAGFDIKYVSSIGSNEKTNLSIRSLVMEAYAGKRAFSLETPQPFNIEQVELDKLIQIATNIKDVEYDNLKYTNLRLDPSAWKMFFENTITQKNECGGIVYKHTDSSNTDIIDGFSILMGCEGSYTGSERQCVTQQAYSHEINFHIHTLACYNKIHQEHYVLASPSLGDYVTTFQQYTNKLKLFHMVVSIEGIYILQVHPYWKFLMDDGYLTNDSECFTSLMYLLNNYTNPMLFGSDINDTLRYSNNLLTPDLLMKNAVSQGHNSSQIKHFKNICIAHGLNRNINLFICSFVRYPRVREVFGIEIPMLEYISFMRELRTSFEGIFGMVSAAELKSRIDTHLEREFVMDSPVEIPYFQYTPEYIEELKLKIS
jgi:hypothetical protein